MDAQLKAKWVEALRSGDYSQAAGFLCKVHGEAKSFCCLGVALDIQGACWVETPSVWQEFVTPACTFNGIRYEANSLEQSLREAFPSIALDDIRYLMAMNDSGVSFAKIADHIEANL